MTATLDQSAPGLDDRSARLDPSSPSRHRLAWRRGHSDEPTWTRWALVALLAATAVLYLWGLGASGYANEYYAAAVQAATQSWKAFLFGSIDSSNFITVDKPPASLWVMELSGRLFGFSSWSMLVPQALEGVAAVALLAATVRRVAGARAGLLAGLLLAATPAAALIFRFNNPDALLTLLLVAAAYATVRALQGARLRWLVVAGVCVGFAILTKMGQGALIVPGLGLAYLIAAPTTPIRRIAHLLIAAGAMVVSAGWWFALVQLWPAGSRPYIGGSTDNSALELMFGYNGLSRLFGGQGNGGGGGGNSGFGGATGLTRVFSSEMGLEVSWLLPAALVALFAGLWLRGRATRLDPLRASLVVWGGWLVVTGLVFSYMQGTIHPYYTVALAPAIAALVALGSTLLWRSRQTLVARCVAAAMLIVTVGWAWQLLRTVPTWHPWVKWAVLAAAVPALLAILFAQRWAGASARRAVVAAMLAVVTIAGIGAPAAASVSTAATPHTGSIPTAFATASGSSGGAGGGAGFTRSDGAPSGAGPNGSGSGSSGTSTSGTSTSGTGPSGASASGTRPSGSGPSGSGSAPTGGGTGTSTDAALVALLKKSTTTWAAATVSAQSAAGLELSSGSAVMAIGGFTGSDSAPSSLAAFKALVAAGKIHYFISGGAGGGGGMAGGSSVGSQIASWVAEHYTATTVGGTTVYDLTTAAS